MAKCSECLRLKEELKAAEKALKEHKCDIDCDCGCSCCKPLRPVNGLFGGKNK